MKIFNCCVLFESGRPVCYRIRFNFIKTTVDFCVITQNFGVKDNHSKTPLSLCSLKLTYLGKIISILLAFGQKKIVCKVAN